MSQYLQFSVLEQQIEDEMANQAPAVIKICRAIDAELRNLQTKYSIETFRRKKSVSIKTDGTAYAISTLITANDVRAIKSIKIVTDDTYFDDIIPVDYEVIMDNIKRENPVNQFCFYYEDGVQYLRVITNDHEDTARDFNVIYDTNKIAIDGSGNYYDATFSGLSTLYVLVPDRFCDLVSLGAQKRLFYQSIGESDQAQVALVRNRYTSELTKLGLDNIAKMIDRNSRKIKIRKPW